MSSKFLCSGAPITSTLQGAAGKAIFEFKFELGFGVVAEPIVCRCAVTLANLENPLANEVGSSAALNVGAD